jgi:hypothetical protein
VTYANLALGHWYYGTESLATSSDWATPKYNDQDTVTAASLSNFFAYSGELFDTNAANDGARNTNADGDITLTARQRVKQGKNQVQLTWAPADGGDVNVLRNGAIRRTVADNGKFNDNLGTMTGTFTYQVCETDTGDCSNEVVVVVTSP